LETHEVTWERPVDFVLAAEDEEFAAAIKIQTAFRAKMARRAVHRRTTGGVDELDGNESFETKRTRASAGMMRQKGVVLDQNKMAAAKSQIASLNEEEIAMRREMEALRKAKEKKKREKREKKKREAAEKRRLELERKRQLEEERLAAKRAEQEEKKQRRREKKKKLLETRRLQREEHMRLNEERALKREAEEREAKAAEEAELSRQREERARIREEARLAKEQEWRENVIKFGQRWDQGSELGRQDLLSRTARVDIEADVRQQRDNTMMADRQQLQQFREDGCNSVWDAVRFPCSLARLSQLVAARIEVELKKMQAREKIKKARMKEAKRKKKAELRAKKEKDVKTLSAATKKKKKGHPTKGPETTTEEEGAEADVQTVQERLYTADELTEMATQTVVKGQNDIGDTMLHIAASEGNVEAVRYLLDIGADINQRDGETARNTPLHDAALAGWAPVIELLVERGAKVCALNGEGNTALHIAMRKGNRAAAKALLRQEDTWEEVWTTTNLRGRTAKDVAEIGPEGGRNQQCKRFHAMKQLIVDYQEKVSILNSAREKQRQKDDLHNKKFRDKQKRGLKSLQRGIKSKKAVGFGSKS